MRSDLEAALQKNLKLLGISELPDLEELKGLTKVHALDYHPDKLMQNLPTERNGKPYNEEEKTAIGKEFAQRREAYSWLLKYLQEGGKPGYKVELAKKPSTADLESETMRQFLEVLDQLCRAFNFRPGTVQQLLVDVRAEKCQKDLLTMIDKMKILIANAPAFLRHLKPFSLLALFNFFYFSVHCEMDSTGAAHILCCSAFTGHLFFGDLFESPDIQSLGAASPLYWLACGYPWREILQIKEIIGGTRDTPLNRSVHRFMEKYPISQKAYDAALQEAKKNNYHELVDALIAAQQLIEKPSAAPTFRR